MKKYTTRMITTMGLLIAVEIVLSRFCSISAWNIKIGVNFIPIALAAVLYGPLPAGIVAALGDLIGATLFPIGTYFPGFTLTAFLTGVTLGVFLHNRRSVPRILGAVAVNQLVWSLLLNTFWISVLYSSPFVPLLATRIVQCAVLGPVQFAGIGVIDRIMGRYGKKAFA